MNTDNLRKANELEKEIRELSFHLRFFKESFEYKNNPLYQIHFSVYNDVAKPKNLRDKFLPLSKEQFISDYATNIENEIARLQLEFDNL